jgi:hypothetical protein
MKPLFQFPKQQLNSLARLRSEAAHYIGAGTTKLDELVRDGLMPRQKRIDGRVIWDRFALDSVFADLSGDDDENGIDRIMARHGVNGSGSIAPPAPLQ